MAGLSIQTGTYLTLAGAAAALITALAVEHGGGWAPCHLCVLARYPHGLALALAGVSLIVGHNRWLIALGALAFLASAGISAYHAGVEFGWIALPSGCVAGGPAESVEELRQMLLAQDEPSCDQAGPRFLGISMALWNVLYSACLTLVVGWLAWRGPERSLNASAAM
ncbi:MAG: disulfide bond formation protein B [Geminicoccaceae bacterium]